MMDFDNVLSIATQNQGVSGVQKRYSLQAGPPKKDPKSKGVNPAAVQALLQKRQNEARKKEIEFKKQKEDLLAKRVELKSDRKARAMASRTKDNFRGYNGIPVVDVPKKRRSKQDAETDGNRETFRNRYVEPEDDGDDAEYGPTDSEPDEEPEPLGKDSPKKKLGGANPKSAPPRMNFADLLKLAEKKQHEPVELKAKAAKEERLRTADELKELELERRAKNRHRRPDGEGRPPSDVGKNEVKNKSLSEKPDPSKGMSRKPLAPPPKERDGAKTPLPPKAKPSSPATPGIPKESTSSVQGRPRSKIHTSRDVKPSLNENTTKNRPGVAKPDPELQREAEKSAPKQGRDSAARPPGGTKIQTPGARAPPAGARALPTGVRTAPARIQAPPAGARAPPAGFRTPPAAAGVRAPPAGVRAPPAGVRVPPAGVRAPPAGVRAPPAGVRAPPAGVRAPPAGARTADGRGSGPGRPQCTVVSRTISSGNVNSLRPGGVPSRSGIPPRPLNRPPGPPLPPITIAYKRKYEEEEEEYDSEMDDFIDDGGDEQEEVSKHIKEIFGYDRSRYKEESDYALKFMESSWRDMQKEEARSLKMAVQEDLEEEKKEQEEMKRLNAKRRRNN
ncbi:protein SPT2 homolog [Corythoichthys intestinalis]|uniref:protein SPT2 homolog n=1 Tax=Corythoichthys intestinalis TaxID=161448 RepID=UPI0025A5D43C|nr:protein SPT2 homolog [Corythoichthys intestinalis]XP_061812394.1 protein SPT2 homolog [Nerophis lumbriciformis]